MWRVTVGDGDPLGVGEAPRRRGPEDLVLLLLVEVSWRIGDAALGPDAGA